MIVSIVLKLCSLGLIIAAAGLWAGAWVDTRPKYKDEQTLVGGTIWSQLIIPIGLLLSKIVHEHIDSWIHGYFLITGVLLCVTTGIVLIRDEVNAKKKRIRNLETEININVNYNYKIYLGIGILSLVAGALTFVQFLILVLT